MQKIKRILVLLMCLALFPIVGCQQKEVVQYDGDVMAVVNRETESFAQPVSDEELTQYFSLVNEIGFSLYKENDDKNIVFSPLSLVNLMLDTSEVIPEEFSADIEQIIPNYESYYRVRDYSRNMFDTQDGSRTIWVTNNIVKNINFDAAQSGLFNTFDFYIIDKSSNRKNEMNSYVNEKLGTNASLISTRNSNQCEVLEINNTSLKVQLDCDRFSYKIKSIQTKKQPKQMNCMIAENVTCKIVRYGAQRVMEFDTNMENVVVDIIFTPSAATTIKTAKFEKISQVIQNLDEAGYTTIALVQIPITNKAYNFTSAQCLKTVGAGFVFEEVDESILNGSAVRINQMNEITQLKTSYEKAAEHREDAEEFLQEAVIEYSYTYIIRNKSTGLFMYIGTCDF